MVKKFLVLFIILCLLVGNSAVVFAEETASKTSYELWTQSPNITCGISDDEIKINIALNQNMLSLYPLPKLGSNYYLAVCEGQMTNGGYSGKSKTSELYFYSILMTDDGFVILSKGRVNNEYYWNYGSNIVDITGNISSSYYTSNGSEMPCYIVNPKGKYTNSNYDEYDDYIFITKNGTLYSTPECSEDGCEGYPFIKDGVLYRGQEKYYSSSRYYYYYLSDGITKAVQYMPYQFKNGATSYGTTAKIDTASLTSANGYAIYKEGFTSNVSAASYYKIPNSDNLYMWVSQPYTYDTTARRYYYYIKVDMYECDNGVMSLKSTKLIPTTNTYAQTLSIKSLGSLDSSFYTSKGYSPPQVVINKNVVILRDGTVCTVSLDATEYSTYWEWSGYNNRLTVIRSRNASSYFYWAENGTNYYWQKLNYVYFDRNGNMIKEADIPLKIVYAANSGQNGYFYSYSSFTAPDYADISYTSVKSWFGRSMDNVFPDGRKVNGRWAGMGGGLYELWYEILKPDGTLLSTGPTGYSANFGSVFDTYDLIAFAVNNSKFIVALNMVQRDWSVEYYRVAVVEENETGEIMASGQLGEKNITAPDTADTEVVQNKIDFGKDDLPIGYNIKNNVIDSGKLDSTLRQQVNAIHLNDVVILAKEGYASGSQNIGVSVPYYSNYDYDFGDTYIRFYTSGQMLYWYCYYPEDLYECSDIKTITTGDKKIYFNVKIVEPPSNNGTTNVTF